MHAPLRIRPLRRLAATLLCCLSATAWAGPDDDYKAGLKSYGNGDVITAMPLLKKAADAGHAPAQALYGQILGRADSDDEAVVYMKKAADQGNPDGQFGYGSMLSGGEGIKRDPVAGRAWVTKAAEQGHKLAINELALAYIKGSPGLTEEMRRSETALRWIRVAADNDFIPAVDALAEAYRAGGLGLDADVRQAEQWSAKSRKLRGISGKRRGDKK